jgi:hypothetical protein
MKKIFLIKDKTDKNYHKPFVSIHTDEAKAIQKINQLRNGLAMHSQSLISMQEVVVKDFDPNKKNVFVIFDKTDRSAKNPVVAVHFDFNNANQTITALRQSAGKHAQKLISMTTEQIAS